MKSEVLTLSEYASEHNGSLTIVDTFDVIEASKFPWRAYFYFTAKLNLEDEANTYDSMTISIVDKEKPDNILFKTSSPLEKPVQLAKLNLVAGFKGLIFDHPGEYIVCLHFDQEVKVEYKFTVIAKMS